MSNRIYHLTRNFIAHNKFMKSQNCTLTTIVAFPPFNVNTTQMCPGSVQKKKKYQSTLISFLQNH